MSTIYNKWKERAIAKTGYIFVLIR